MGRRIGNTETRTNLVLAQRTLGQTVVKTVSLIRLQTILLMFITKNMKTIAATSGDTLCYNNTVRQEVKYFMPWDQEKMSSTRPLESTARILLPGCALCASFSA